MTHLGSRHSNINDRNDWKKQSMELPRQWDGKMDGTRNVVRHHGTCSSISVSCISRVLRMFLRRGSVPARPMVYPPEMEWWLNHAGHNAHFTLIQGDYHQNRWVWWCQNIPCFTNVPVLYKLFLWENTMDQCQPDSVSRFIGDGAEIFTS